ncbi:retrovirus-related pol polyprotein from transposon TNT 1-94 [Tanacetum coccineum]
MESYYQVYKLMKSWIRNNFAGYYIWQFWESTDNDSYGARETVGSLARTLDEEINRNRTIGSTLIVFFHHGQKIQEVLLEESNQLEQSIGTGFESSNARQEHSHQCTKFLNQTLHAYFKEEGIEHQTSTPRTPEQNGVVERRNRTLVEAARTMLSGSKLPFIIRGLELVDNARKNKRGSMYHGGSNSNISRRAIRVYNKRTRLIVESIHIKFDEIKEMMSDHNSSDLAPQRQEMSVENVSSGLVSQGQKASDYDNSDPE